ncbi:hypothetical protein [Amycolatopsis sp. Hca4]|uniref:hypothetical protein n=1 Tax=Amycolatopsis sp. Hca4 TaxID=2742131 RepID=UPI0020CAA5C9|nr:hypothetical protein [Amycolatopsis sp. Hca4]
MAALGPDADPLATLEKLRRAHGAVFTGRGGEIYVSDPVLAKAILANGEGLFREHSDFFRIRTGMFAPRSAQVEIGGRPVRCCGGTPATTPASSPCSSPAWRPGAAGRTRATGSCTNTSARR